MKIRTKIIVFTSILFLATSAFIGCGDRSDQAGTTDTQTGDQAVAPGQTQDQDYGATQDYQTDQDYGMAGEQDQMAQDQQFGQAQNLEEFMGRQVADSEGQVLGSVAQVHSTGEATGFVFIQGEDQEMHAVPSDLLTEGPEGELMASFDQQTFQQSPTYSEEEIQQLSEVELEEVRGYYQENAGETGQMQSY